MTTDRVKDVSAPSVTALTRGRSQHRRHFSVEWRQTSSLAGYVAHFDVTTVDGEQVRYRDLWQRRILVLVAGRPDERDGLVPYASRLADLRRAFDDCEATVVITTDRVKDVSAPSVIVADRWGEVQHRRHFSVAEPPDVEELLSWVRFIQTQCPECPP